MYNRYIPQSDGTFRRNPVSESRTNPIQNTPPPPFSREESKKTERQEPARQTSGNRKSPEPETITCFLRKLLPKGFDTGDLLVVLLLLLMSADCKEEQNTALLTLVLYLFL